MRDVSVDLPESAALSIPLGPELKAEAELVILVGSEGGSTRGFAASLHRALTATGARVHVGDMDAVGPMPRARALIVMAATYGDGVAPASARRFLDRLDGLSPLPVAVLGFGDRAFPRFCAYAETVAAALDAIGGVIKDYIDIPATISVDQGAVVMVMVNADLELFP